VRAWRRFGKPVDPLHAIVGPGIDTNLAENARKESPMKKSRGFARIVSLFCLSLAPFASQSSPQPALDYPIVCVGDIAPSPSESAELWAGVVQYQTDPQAGLATLEQFVSDHPDSPWTPSLRSNLGAVYRKLGRDTLALQHWEAAWKLLAILRIPTRPAFL